MNPKRKAQKRRLRLQLKNHRYSLPACLVLLIGTLLLTVSLFWFLHGILFVLPADPCRLYLVYIPAMESIVALYTVTFVGTLTVEMAVWKL